MVNNEETTLVLHVDGTEDATHLKLGKKRIATINRDDDSWTAAEKVLEALGVELIWDSQVE